ncbi:MAG: GNAT family N-acetyltransferase [Oscillospiraceae bacterium]|nr:GNAT family N-acetyltransferase [Oscillospiraceae bacterium]
MIFRTIKPNEFDAWVQLCADGFGQPPTEFHDHFVNDPYADYDGVFVACDGDKMVSTVRVFRREIYLNGQKVKMGGIGEVCTLKEYRKQGLSSELLRMSIDYMNNNDMPVSMLFTGVNGHYLKHGWFTVIRRVGDVALDVPQISGGFRTPTPADTDVLVKLYVSSNSNYNCMLVREKEYWNKWVAHSINKQAVIEVNGEIAAYLEYRINGDKIYFCEYTGEKDFMFAAFSLLGGTGLLNVPEMLINDFSSENYTMMLRLNNPFGEITSPGKLAALAAESMFFVTDGY